MFPPCLPKIYPYEKILLEAQPRNYDIMDPPLLSVYWWRGGGVVLEVDGPDRALMTIHLIKPLVLEWSVSSCVEVSTINRTGDI